MDDLLHEFLTECLDSVAVLDGELVGLERQPNDPALIAGIFRRVHSIKGTCGFFGLARLEALTHATETVRGKLRDGELAASRAIVDVLLDASDRINEILEGLATRQAEPAGNDTALIAALDRLGASDELPHAPRSLAAGRPIADETERRAAADPPDRAETNATMRAPRNGAGSASLAGQTVRVPIGLLEHLTTLVGELEQTREQLLRIERLGGDPVLRSPLRRLERITGALQQGVMTTRLQPIGTAWSRRTSAAASASLEKGPSGSMPAAKVGASSSRSATTAEVSIPRGSPIGPSPGGSSARRKSPA